MPALAYWTTNASSLILPVKRTRSPDAQSADELDHAPVLFGRPHDNEFEIRGCPGDGGDGLKQVIEALEGHIGAVGDDNTVGDPVRFQEWGKIYWYRCRWE